jgi:NAD(P)H-dependent FMN reductase
MYKKNKITSVASIVIISIVMICISSCKEIKSSHDIEHVSTKMNLKIILGSTRQGRTSEKIGNALMHVLNKRADITTEIIDLKDYNLTFLYDEVMPISRKVITDPATKKWSDKIAQADAFIIVVPEYNAGYPGVLKNALDILYKEWNNKPVGFVGYSGGSSGGAHAVAQLHDVALALEMIPVTCVITIPSAWKALDTKGNLINMNIASELNTMVDQLIKTQPQI